jgi:hypothetical protein
VKMNGNSSGGGEFQHPTTGTVNAVCVRIVDLGTQESTWEGKVSKKRKVMFSWEISELMNDGRPFLVSARYTASIGKMSAFGPLGEAWLGRQYTDKELLDGLDNSVFLGLPCLLTLVKNKEYTNVSSVVQLPKGFPPLQPVGSLIYLDLDNFDPAAFDALSEKVKQTIEKSPEYAKATGKTHDPSHDIPF